MAKDERLNEEAAMNNNLSSATIMANKEIAKDHKKAKLNQKRK